VISRQFLLHLEFGVTGLCGLVLAENGLRGSKSDLQVQNNGMNETLPWERFCPDLQVASTLKPVKMFLLNPVFH
tara:strand:+ start:482 stop:703 length:222 start_codon:yes stop_codon:yes gene_type:complete